MSAAIRPQPMDGLLVVATIGLVIIVIALVFLAREIARQRRLDRALAQMIRIRMQIGAERMRQAARRSVGGGDDHG